MYAELHTHNDLGSNVRLIDSTCKVDKIIDKAIEYGFAGVAITDHESLSAHIKAIKKYKSVKEKHPDFRLVLGNEIYLINESDYKNTNKFFHFILLAKDSVGHRQLRLLSSRAWSRVYSHKNVERVPTFYSDLQEIIGAEPGHIIGMTACLGGFFPMVMLEERYDVAVNFAEWCKSLFGEGNFYIELQPGVSEDQILFNKRAILFSETYGYEYVITNDVHYLTKDKRNLHAAFLNSKDEERETSDFYESTYFKTEEEMLQRMDYLDKEAVLRGFANTVSIVNKIEEYDLKQDVIIPTRPLPEFKVQNIFAPYYSKYEYIRKFAQSDYQQDLFMLSEVEKGFLSKPRTYWKVTDENGNTTLIPYTSKPADGVRAEIYSISDEDAVARINEEFKQLWEISDKLGQRMSSYYNLVQCIVQLMWADDGGNSLVGPSRGSVTGYYITYLMDIIQIDALQWDLPFWRHLHASRPELPDVDLDSQSSQRPLIFQKIKEFWGDNRTLNIITFRKETSKAAIQTACRGLGIDNDTAKELSSLIPIVRGKVWSINDCLYGNPEEDRLPVKEFIDKVAQFDGLEETVKEIENLISGRGSHASGLYLFNSDYVEQNSLMKSPKGIYTTCWEQEDSDYAGALKIDELTVEALDKIRQCMNLLLQDNIIQWQGSLKATYDKYFHPSIIDYTTKGMWDTLDKGQITDVFEFDTLVGSEAIKKIQPRNLKQVSLASSVMRLMGDGTVNPIDRFTDYKSNVQLWYDEMASVGLNSDEIAILEKYLLRNSGNSIEQEDIMELSMDEHIAGFDIVLANKLRKGVAKKKPELIAEIKSKFFAMGKERGARDVFLTYVWDFMVKPQLGYSFSRNHTLPYSAMALIEMNQSYHYPSIYWNCACLTINASANEEVEDNKSTDYGKIAKAIGDMKHRGVKIALPDINAARFGFSPDRENNQIVFGLKGINSIGDDIVEQIVANRPYSSLLDFCEKNADIPIKPMINLIKAGCFDSLQPNRVQAMTDYIVYLTQQKVPSKESLTMQNYAKAFELGIIPEKHSFEARLTNFRKYVCSKQFLVKTGVYRFDLKARLFFENEVQHNLTEGIEYKYLDGEIVLIKNKFDKWYNTLVVNLKEWLVSPEAAAAFTKASYNSYAKEIWDKYCEGSISRWEMDSICFYYHPHELEYVDKGEYGITDYKDIPELPVVVGYSERKNKATGEAVRWEKYQLYKIVGTVLDRNANKNYITLLTPSGVVTAKFYSGSFTHYDKQISIADLTTGKKTVIEKSWFSRGNKLLITGIRRGDMFYPKRYNDSIYQHTVCLIENVSSNGKLNLKYERERV